VSAALFRRPWLRAGLLLSGPAAWFVLIYLGALFLLFLSALWSVDSFSGKIVHSWTLSNFETLFKVSAYRTIARINGGHFDGLGAAAGQCRASCVREDQTAGRDPGKYAKKMGHAGTRWMSN